MSDALTDIARDERREKLSNEFWDALADFIEHKNQVNRNKLIKAAEDCDCVRRGYWESQTSLVSLLERLRIVKQ